MRVITGPFYGGTIDKILIDYPRKRELSIIGQIRFEPPWISAYGMASTIDTLNRFSISTLREGNCNWR
jgi:hypothetical protein